MYTNEGVRPLWRSGGKPLSQLSDEELTAAIDYVQAQESGDVALLKALRALRDERVAATDVTSEEQQRDDSADPPLHHLLVAPGSAPGATSPAGARTSGRARRRYVCARSPHGDARRRKKAYRRVSLGVTWKIEENGPPSYWPARGRGRVRGRADHAAHQGRGAARQRDPHPAASPRGQRLAQFRRWPKACALLTADDMKAVLPQITKIVETPHSQKIKIMNLDDVGDDYDAPGTSCEIRFWVAGSEKRRRRRARPRTGRGHRGGRYLYRRGQLRPAGPGQAQDPGRPRRDRVRAGHRPLLLPDAQHRVLGEHGLPLYIDRFAGQPPRTEARTYWVREVLPHFVRSVASKLPAR